MALVSDMESIVLPRLVKRWGGYMGDGMRTIVRNVSAKEHEEMHNWWFNRA